jgi:hypothetical protein
VARRINDHPRSAREWDAIEMEVRYIQQLMPNHWLAPYLQDKIAEVRTGGLGSSRARQSPSPSNNLVVRGSAPEPDQPPARRFPRLLGRSREPAVDQTAATTPPASPPASPAPASNQSATEGYPGSPPAADFRDEVLLSPESSGSDRPNIAPDARDSGRIPAGEEPESSAPIAWQTLETTNFRIYHGDANLARQAAKVAEAVRSAQAKRWGSPAFRRPWLPRCDLFLHPTPKSYAEATNQPEASPGISTLTNNGARVLSRRMNLRADHPQLLTAILPHEVTHVVLADLFVVQQVPRWADEGIAVLAEPLTEQRSRVADLQEPLGSGRVIHLDKLMAMDYPDDKERIIYYAQSVSLTSYLVEQGTPEQFIRFVQESQRLGSEIALRNIYHINGVPDLEKGWLAYARNQAALSTASSRDPNAEPSAIQRR